ncbi:hypothetical protein G3143_004025 [Salmonella enterica subsp. enterica serovar Javiana]|nr:hypothetical protein [Salmonella enterica]EDT7228984.1 hypothetical protein [Salmonella enterica subsp. enterica]EEG7331016.1 hypothetical protein [Salmonella enterica subsp. enterica serovar Javiana]ECW8338102.1 hypothetical protein [Salmonella enterica]ECW8355934.1 hypothetical protein [Salmonella enterica]
MNKITGAPGNVSGQIVANWPPAPLACSRLRVCGMCQNVMCSLSGLITRASLDVQVILSSYPALIPGFCG